LEDRTEIPRYKYMLRKSEKKILKRI